MKGRGLRCEGTRRAATVPFECLKGLFEELKGAGRGGMREGGGAEGGGGG